MMLSSVVWRFPVGGIFLLLLDACALLIFLFSRPIKLGFKLLWNAGIGFVLLFLVNLLGGYIGLQIPITVVSALVAGFFGVPGVIALIAFQVIL